MKKTTVRKLVSVLLSLSLVLGLGAALAGGEDVFTLDEKYLVVKFPDRERKFQYPQAFENGYLEVTE